MICRKINLEYSQFSYKDNKHDLLEMLESSCKQNEGVASDYIEKDSVMVSKRREQQEVLRDLLTALAICNNVTPVDISSGPVVADFDSAEVDIQKMAGVGIGRTPVKQKSINEMGGEIDPQLEAASPDEVALVKFGYSVKMRLIER